MTAPVREPESETCGYLLCRHRRYGCDWSTIYRALADRVDAERRRDIHELICQAAPRTIGDLR